jgi:hypothetical protein
MLNDRASGGTDLELEHAEVIAGVLRGIQLRGAVGQRVICAVQPRNSGSCVGISGIQVLQGQGSGGAG